MTDYTAPTRDMRFILNELVGLEQIATLPGCGEVGAIGSPPAIINALVDALKEYGVRHINMPATPLKIWSIVQAGKPAMAAE